MHDKAWFQALVGTIEPYNDDPTAEDVTVRMAEMGYDAQAIVEFAYEYIEEHIDEIVNEIFKEPSIPYQMGRWLAFGIEIGIRAERTCGLEAIVGG